MSVVVLGMHRSGTSVVTGMLELLGVPLGRPDDLMPPTEANPRGYFESDALRWTNDAVLAALGGTWDNPPDPAEGWDAVAPPAGVAERMRSTFAEVYGDAPTWLWKDPRNCLLLPLWRAATGMRPAAVLVVRNPLEVIDSLVRRDGHSFHTAAALWELHTRRALAAVADLPTFVVAYDDVLAAPTATAAALRDFLADAGEPVREDVPRAALAELVDPTLRHGCHDPDDVATHPELSSQQQALHARLLAAAGAHAEGRAVDAGRMTGWAEALLAERRAVPLSVPEAVDGPGVTATWSSAPDLPLDLVVVTRDEATLLAAFAMRLAATTEPGRAGLVFVDVCSTDPTPIVLASLEGDEVHVLRTPVAVGHAAALREGLAAGAAPVVCLSSCDVALAPGWHAVLEDVFAQRPDIDALRALHGNGRPGLLAVRRTALARVEGPRALPDRASIEQDLWEQLVGDGATVVDVGPGGLVAGSLVGAPVPA